MTIKRSARPACYVGLLLVLGCVSAVEPLCSEQEATIDTRLIGAWCEDKDIFKFSADPGTNSLMVHVKDDPASSVVRTIRIGKHDYFSFRDASDLKDNNSKTVQPEESAKKSTINWDIGRYLFVSDDEVRFFALDDAKVAAAIKSGELKGNIIYEKSRGLFGNRRTTAVVADVELTSSPAELREYLENHPDDCFDLKKPFFTLRRMVDK